MAAPRWIRRREIRRRWRGVEEFTGIAIVHAVPVALLWLAFSYFDFLALLAIVVLLAVGANWLAKREIRRLDSEQA